MTLAETVAKLSKVAPWLAEDIEAEAALISLEAKRDDLNEAWQIECLHQFADRAIACARKEFAQPKIESGRLPRFSRPSASTLTKGQRKKLLRDMAIQLAFRGGMSQRSLAKVFDLPPSRIGVIVRKELG